MCVVKTPAATKRGMPTRKKKKEGKTRTIQHEGSDPAASVPKKKKRKMKGGATAGAAVEVALPPLPGGEPHPGYDEEEFGAEAFMAAMAASSCSDDDGFNQSSSDDGFNQSSADDGSSGGGAGAALEDVGVPSDDCGGGCGDRVSAGSGPTAGELYEQYYCGERTAAALEFSDTDLEQLAPEGTQPATMAFSAAYDGGGAVVLTRAPLLARVECSRAISIAEAHAAAQRGGWTTSRHHAVPTTDIPVARMPPLLDWFNSFCETRLFPLIAYCFQSSPVGGGSAFGADALRVKDAFVVKYDAAGGQVRLPKHKDQSDFSVTIALNDGDAYSGGGTRFFGKLKKAVARPARGHVVAFEGGELSHSGVKITSGTRYILAVFMDVMFI